MRQWFAGMLPVSRRGRDADPEIAAGGAIGRRAGQDAAVRGPRPHHCLGPQPRAAGLHKRDIDQPDLETRSRPYTGQWGRSDRNLTVVPANAGTTLT